MQEGTAFHADVGNRGWQTAETRSISGHKDRGEGLGKELVLS